MELFEIFILLLIGHAVGDYVLQPDPMSRGKSRDSKLPEKYGENFPRWYYWLSAHALTHSGIVYLITGSLFLILLEFISHCIIDFCKCEKWISLNADQALHLLFKVIYCILIYYQMA